MIHHLQSYGLHGTKQCVAYYKAMLSDCWSYALEVTELWGIRCRAMGYRLQVIGFSHGSHRSHRFFFT